MKYVIEKGIPVPKKRSEYKFLKEMEIGDSVLITDYPKNAKGNAVAISGIANSKLSPKKFTQKWTKEGLRIWRIE